MNTTELIEQLQLIIHDHPEAANLDVRVNERDIFAVHLRHEEGDFVMKTMLRISSKLSVVVFLCYER